MAATVFNQAQLELLDVMQWVKRKEMIYVTKEDIQMPGMWVRDRNI